MHELVQTLLIVAPPTLLLLETVRRCPFRRLVGGAAAASRMSLRLLSSKDISDRWKERALLAYSGRILRHSLGLGGLVLLLLAGFAAALHLSGRLWQPGFDAGAALMAADYLGTAVGVAILSLALRRLARHA